MHECLLRENEYLICRAVWLRVQIYLDPIRRKLYPFKETNSLYLSISIFEHSSSFSIASIKYCAFHFFD